MPSDKLNADNKLLRELHIKIVKLSDQVLTLKFIPSTLNSKPTPGGRRIDVTSVPLHWAYNPLHTVYNINDNTREYITFAEFCKLCSESKYAKVILSLCDILGKIPFPFYWECAPIKQLTDPMKIYLVKAEFTTRNADITAFESQITAKNKNDYALHFPSVTGASELIIPNPLQSDNAIKFTHMRNFMKYTTGDNKTGDKMRLAFWAIVAQTAIQFLKKNGIIYLKTHGHGVNYFHFRLQKTNAYYVLQNFS